MKRIPLTLSIILLLCCYANAQSQVEHGGVVSEGLYINSDFGFSDKFPKDWVVHGALNLPITPSREHWRVIA